jgi:hypothetical protein
MSHNYIYDAVDYEVPVGKVKRPTARTRNYAKLLPETQIQEDENSVYTEPEHSYYNYDTSMEISRQRVRRVQTSKILITIIVILVILLVFVTTAGVAVSSTGWHNYNQVLAQLKLHIVRNSTQ